MSLILKDFHDSVGTVTMNNQEKRNALSEQLVHDIIGAMAAFQEKQVRVLILRAPAGATVWSAGHDIDELPKIGRDPLGWSDSLRVLIRGIQEFPAPVIALIEGSVWGGACEVAMACDMIVATAHTTFAITPAKLGIPYNLTGLLTLMNTVPLQLAKEMLFTARPISAERAYELGVVNYLCPPEELEQCVREVAIRICANAPLSIAAMKEELRMLAGAQAMTPNMFERMQGIRRVVYDSKDYQEGQDAFREKRKPKFKGE